MRNVVQLSSCMLDAQRDPLRLPPRPVSIRNPDYEDQFDFTSLFCDVFWERSGEGVLLLGPPLLNLLGHSGLEFRALPSGATCNPAITHRFWMDQVNLPVPPGTTGIDLHCGNACFTLSIQSNLSHLFKGRRAVFTMNRNNDFTWIRDWVKFQRDAHGCDGILLYDHQSDAYALADLHDTIQSVHADLQVAVLSWPFPYGVFDGRHELTYNIYDSFYSQAVILEHARRRFLGHART